MGSCVVLYNNRTPFFLLAELSLPNDFSFLSLPSGCLANTFGKTLRCCFWTCTHFDVTHQHFRKSTLHAPKKSRQEEAKCYIHLGNFLKASFRTSRFSKVKGFFFGQIFSRSLPYPNSTLSTKPTMRNRVRSISGGRRGQDERGGGVAQCQEELCLSRDHVHQPGGRGRRRRPEEGADQRGGQQGARRTSKRIETNPRNQNLTHNSVVVVVFVVAGDLMPQNCDIFFPVQERGGGASYTTLSPRACHY